jgi:hypothetical protein
MPPATFADLYARQVIKAQVTLMDVVAAHAASGPQDVGTVQSAVRIALRTIALIAEGYENTPGAQVAANLMIFSRIAELPRATKERPAHEVLSFASPGLSWESLTGVLHLQPELSARASGEFTGPDPSVHEMYLPLPADRQLRAKGRSVWAVLPGAPLAWVKREPTSWPSIEALRAWCDEDAALHVDATFAMLRYFSHSAEIRSFVSIPFGQAADGSPTAVLNVHSSAQGLLEKRDQMLYVLLKPLLEILVHLLKYLEAPADLPIARALDEPLMQNDLSATHAFGGDPR